MTTLTMNRRDQAVALAADLWNHPHTELHAEDLSTLFSWMKDHLLFHVIHPMAGSSALIAIHTKGKTPLVFLPMQLKDNVQALNLLLRRERLTLPYDLPAEMTAKTLRTFIGNLRGFVASETLCEQQQSSLPLWISPLGDAGEEVFKSYCQNPHLKVQGDKWILMFYFFNALGGVELWTIHGFAESVREATFKSMLPNGTFFYPYA